MAFNSPASLPAGGRGLHRLQWRPFLTWFFALPEPNRGQWVPDGTVECGQCGSGLWLVSSFVSCSSPLPADAVSLWAHSPLTASSPLCCLLTGTSCSQHLDLGPRYPLTGRWVLPSTTVFSFMVLIRGDVVNLLLNTQLYVELQGFIHTGMYTTDAQD